MRRRLTVHRREARLAAASTVVVGVDGSAGSLEALRWALEEARVRNVRLRAIHSWIYLHALVPALVGYPYTAEAAELDAADTTASARRAAETVLDHALAVLGDTDDVEVERAIVQGPAAQVLIDAVSEHDLLVVGSRGHGGFAALLLGSVSHQCAQHAPCPVVVVRAANAANAPEEQPWTSG
jgi:nucleotide-binding universal stress UspA family protein